MLGCRKGRISGAKGREVNTVSHWMLSEVKIFRELSMDQHKFEFPTVVSATSSIFRASRFNVSPEKFEQGAFGRYRNIRLDAAKNILNGQNLTITLNHL
jgi:hypothetical protein